MNSPNLKGQNEDTGRRTQLQTIFQCLQEHVATTSMIAVDTGIPQKNICRNKRDLEKADMVPEVDKKTYEKTGHMARHLTTNPEKAPLYALQLNLWG